MRKERKIDRANSFLNGLVGRIEAALYDAILAMAFLYFLQE